MCIDVVNVQEGKDRTTTTCLLFFVVTLTDNRQIRSHKKSQIVDEWNVQKPSSHHRHTFVNSEHPFTSNTLQ